MTKKIEFSRDLDLKLKINDGDLKPAAELFKSVGDHFRNDINAVWQRGQFFLTANLTMLAFFFSTAFKRENIASVFVISVVGILLSFLWFRIAKATVAWINVWRNSLIHVEQAIFEYGPYERGENLDGKSKHEKYRPEEFSPKVALTFILIWFFVLVGGCFHLFNGIAK